ncbi:flagellin [Caldanaerobacter subterraneus]|uniref:Flagellin n=1 Tax=Caldanaerobacter subterraneus TaxID=911092 RepID=A0A7Y2PNE9_9THEO|nr:flagellin [Caldanaerobacter subterraneus]NNG67706.1 flagellin [Caldanaerobacter subterraneus]
MIINHNLSALNAWRALSINTANTQKALEKLSSGYRINRAGDDAAGLAISEKMRAQIRGLEMASKNAQDAISLIQTAEGALNETHAILQRMRELAVQAANSTNTPDDLDQIQKEIDQLAQELSRISNTTEFNTLKLLDGTFKGIFHIGANAGQNISLEINDMRSAALGVVGSVYYQDTGTVTLGTSSLLTDGDYTVVYDSANDKYLLKSSTGTVVAESTDGGKTYQNSAGDKITFNDKVQSGTVTITTDSSTSTVTATATAKADNVGGLASDTYTYDSMNKVLKNSKGEVVATTTDGKTFVDANGNTVFQLGVALSDGATVTVKGIGIEVTSQDAANRAINVIQKAINTVSTERSKLGAYQNRLEHTINNLGTAAENLTAAESRIRDVDMAKAMMEFTKNNILQQAATAMLAQANQLPQTVLQLLR